jgi:hypothetical protein
MEELFRISGRALRGDSADLASRGMLFNIALNYGGRAEIVEAARRIMTSGISPDELDEQRFGDFLYTAGQPDPDLLIRTSGEMRISNFLLWQIAYAEIWVTDTLWPDFRKRHLLEAVLAYQKRERRYADQLAGRHRSQMIQGPSPSWNDLPKLGRPPVRGREIAVGGVVTVSQLRRSTKQTWFALPAGSLSRQLRFAAICSCPSLPCASSRARRALAAREYLEIVNTPIVPSCSPLRCTGSSSVTVPPAHLLLLMALLWVTASPQGESFHRAGDIRCVRRDLRQDAARHAGGDSTLQGWSATLLLLSTVSSAFLAVLRQPPAKDGRWRRPSARRNDRRRHRRSRLRHCVHDDRGCADDSVRRLRSLVRAGPASLAWHLRRPVESRLKRVAGVKGRFVFIPEHGGVLDRITHCLPHRPSTFRSKHLVDVLRFSDRPAP